MSLGQNHHCWSTIGDTPPPSFETPMDLSDVEDTQILIGNPHIFIGDPIFSLETATFSLETPRFLLETPVFLLETPHIIIWGY